MKRIILSVLLGISQLNAADLSVSLSEQMNVTTTLNLSCSDLDLGFVWENNILIPEAIKIKNNRLSFGSADFTGFLDIYYSKRPVLAAEFFNAAGATITGPAAFTSFALFMQEGPLFSAIINRKQSKDYISVLNWPCLSVGSIVSSYRDRQDEYCRLFGTKKNCTAFIALYKSEGPYSCYSALQVNFAVTLPLSAMLFLSGELAYEKVKWTLNLSVNSPSFSGNDGRLKDTFFAWNSILNLGTKKRLLFTLVNNGQLFKELPGIDENLASNNDVDICWKISNIDQLLFSVHFGSRLSMSVPDQHDMSVRMQFKRDHEKIRFVWEYNYVENYYQIFALVAIEAVYKAEYFSLGLNWEIPESLSAELTIYFPYAELRMFSCWSPEQQKYTISIRDL